MNRSWRIGHILGLGTIALVLALTAAIAAISAQSVAEGMRAQIGLQLEQRARTAADRFDQFLWARKQDMQFLAYLEYLFAEGGDDDARGALERLQTLIPMFSWIGLTDASGTVRASTGGILEGESIAGRPVYTEGIKGIFMGDVHEAVLLSGLLPNPTGETMKFVDFSFGVPGPDGTPVGVLAAHIDWQWIGEIRNSFLSADPSGNSELLILSAQDGMVILGPRDELGAVPDYGPTVMGDEDAGHFHYRGETRQEYAAGFAKSLGYSDFPGFGWTIVAREPLDEADYLVRGQVRNVWLTGFFAALAAGAIAWLLSRAVSRPLEALLSQSEALRQGEIDFVADVTVVREISGLADSLNHLAANLDKMEGLALRDPLTGLHNRAGAREWLETARARCVREGLTMEVLVIDLDGFKPVNDRYGHEAGDAALKAVSRRLTALARGEELLARWGGDEFLIVQFSVPGDESGARALANRIIESIKAPVDWEETALTVGCSVGGAAWDPRSPIGWDEAFAAADEALYRSKRAGKGRFTMA